MSERATTRGAFITMEGGEGGGKSTQAKALVGRLKDAGLDAIATREPGGSPTAEALREALLAGTFEKLGPRVEALLFSAARIDHLDWTIKPALAAGTWVVSDRFHDSTRAYQGALGELEPRFLDVLERVTLAGTRPDLTLVLDVPAHVGLARADAAAGRRRRGPVRTAGAAFPPRSAAGLPGDRRPGARPLHRRGRHATAGRCRAGDYGTWSLTAWISRHDYRSTFRHIYRSPW